MSLNLPSLTRRALAAVFRLGPPVVRSGVFYRPTAFNQSTGWTVSAEIAAPCLFIGTHILSGGYLGIAPVMPGTENLLIRTAELTGITSPGSGDYVIEDASGLRRNVQASRLDLPEQFYVLQCLRSADEDWGDLTAHTVAEDWADLTSTNAFEDRLALT